MASRNVNDILGFGVLDAINEHTFLRSRSLRCPGLGSAVALFWKKLGHGAYYQNGVDPGNGRETENQMVADPFRELDGFQCGLEIVSNVLHAGVFPESTAGNETFSKVFHVQRFDDASDAQDAARVVCNDEKVSVEGIHIQRRLRSRRAFTIFASSPALTYVQGTIFHHALVRPQAFDASEFGRNDFSSPDGFSKGYDLVENHLCLWRQTPFSSRIL